MMEWLLFAILAGLNVADVVLTLAILKKGGGELNPAMRFFIARLGRVVGLVVPKIAVIAAAVAGILLLGSHPIYIAALIALCVVYAVIVINNFRVLKRQREG
jgi:hypothetical protein